MSLQHYLEKLMEHERRLTGLATSMEPMELKVEGGAPADRLTATIDEMLAAAPSVFELQSACSTAREELEELITPEGAFQFHRLFLDFLDRNAAASALYLEAMEQLQHVPQLFRAAAKEPDRLAAIRQEGQALAARASELLAQAQEIDVASAGERLEEERSRLRGP